MTRLHLTTALPPSLTTGNDPGSVTGAQASSREAALQGSSSQAPDQARLSTTGGLVASALNGSDVRTAKVAALQQAIAAGTYQVSAGDVADKLISSLLGEG